MKTNSIKLTVVTEAVLEAEICQALGDLGASGYTVTDARGAGSRGVRSAGWPTSSSIRIEILCSEEVCESIADYLREKYYKNYAMVLWESNVAVLRPEKFT